jgi:hypothetical protein
MKYAINLNEKEFKYLKNLVHHDDGLMATYNVYGSYGIKKALAYAEAEVEWERCDQKQYKSKGEFFSNEFFIPVV